MNGKAREDAIRERLAKLARAGRLTPDQVVADARKPTSPLHDEFEWDDSKAAQKYRLEQARGLIASVEVQIQTTSRIVTSVAYVRDPRLSGREQGYVSTVTLRDEKDVARDALRNEAARAHAYLERVRSLAVALGLEGEVEEIMERFETFRERLQAA